MSGLIDLGQIAGAYGIKGWVKVHSYTEPGDNIFRYQPWQIKARHGIRSAECVEWRPQGKSYVAHIKGVVDRSQAESLGVVTIAIEESCLPGLEAGEFYWHQLQGCRVISRFDGGRLDFGVVKRILPTGANDVLVVAADGNSMDERERLIPYLPGRFVSEVELKTHTIIVDWDPDF